MWLAVQANWEGHCQPQWPRPHTLASLGFEYRGLDDPDIRAPVINQCITVLWYVPLLWRCKIPSFG
jgi:hypothetical protein